MGLLSYKCQGKKRDFQQSLESGAPSNWGINILVLRGRKCERRWENGKSERPSKWSENSIVFERETACCKPLRWRSCDASIATPDPPKKVGMNDEVRKSVRMWDAHAVSKLLLVATSCPHESAGHLSAARWRFMWIYLQWSIEHQTIELTARKDP